MYICFLQKGKKVVIHQILAIFPVAHFNIILILNFEFDLKSICCTQESVYHFRSIRPKPNKVPEIVFPEYESEGTISQVTLLAVELGSKSGQILFGGKSRRRWGVEI